MRVQLGIRYYLNNTWDIVVNIDDNMIIPQQDVRKIQDIILPVLIEKSMFGARGSLPYYVTVKRDIQLIILNKQPSDIEGLLHELSDTLERNDYCGWR